MNIHCEISWAAGPPMKIAAKIESLICVGSVAKNTCKAPGLHHKPFENNFQEIIKSSQSLIMVIKKTLHRHRKWDSG